MDATAKKKDSPSKEEDKPAGAKKRPIKVIQIEDISVPIFGFDHEIDGAVRVNYSWSLNRSYKDSTGQVVRTQWLGQDDCGKALAAVKQAGEVIASLNAAAEAGQ